jgi:hypothetical protein
MLTLDWRGDDYRPRIDWLGTVFALSPDQLKPPYYSAVRLFTAKNGPRQTSTKSFCDHPGMWSILIGLAERNGIGSHRANPSSDVMSLQQRARPRNFRADDRTTCPECSNPMGLARRAPHLTLGAAFERQTFTCRTCRYQVERNADAQGNPLPAGSNAYETS